MTVRVLSVIGTRPESIKMAPVIRALESSAGIESRVCVTAQHRDMLDTALRFFDIKPDYDLDLMSEAQGLVDVTNKVLAGVHAVVTEARPHLVLVHGDTNTTVSSALAAFYARTPVGHVEAGLRTGDRYSPWPEEMNRRVTGALANIHFAPTEAARSNLLREGVDRAAIHVTGNTAVDALLWTRRRIEADTALQADCRRTFEFIDDHKRLIVVTGHRRENFGRGLEEICSALVNIAARGDVEVVYPVHLNPAVRAPVEAMLGHVESIHLIPPLQYPLFVYLMDRSDLILTDSGGIQEEAPSLGKPVLVMRDRTERPEAVAIGAVRIVGASALTITEEANRLLDDQAHYAAMQPLHNPFGDGQAAERIVQAVRAQSCQ